MEFFSPVICSHAIRLHHNEPQFRQGMLPSGHGEFLGRKGTLRTRIHFLQNRISFCGIKVGGLDDGAINVRLPVPSFGGEPFGRLPTGGEECRAVAPLEGRHQLAIGGPPQFGDSRLIGPRPRINQPLAVRRKGHPVGAIPLRQPEKTSAIQIHPAQM